MSDLAECSKIPLKFLKAHYLLHSLDLKTNKYCVLMTKAD